MTEDARRSRILHRQLVRRYTIALLAIALILILSAVLLNRQLLKNQQDAYLINTSGRQRMLSQRIALLTSEILSQRQSGRFNSPLGDLRTAYDAMRSDHLELTTRNSPERLLPPVSRSLREYYFEQMNVNNSVQTYLNKTEQLLTLCDDPASKHSADSDASGKAARIETLATEITDTARHGSLLSELDAVVGAYQTQYERKLAEFQKLEHVLSVIGLVVLGLEALLIFRPTVKFAVGSVRSLEDANDELIEFSYRISHDLKAPIVSSTGLVDAAQNAIDAGDWDEAGTALGFMKKSLTKLLGTIDDIVTLSRMKVSVIDPEPFSISELIREAIESIRDLPQSERIEMTVNHRGPDHVHGKRLYVKQSIENLVSNAIKYSDPDQPRPRVEINAQVRESKALITVSDNGLGIDPRFREKVFTMFERFHPRISFGSGLGLYLIRQNMKAIGGSVRYNPLDPGSEFSLEFPIQRLPAE